MPQPASTDPAPLSLDESWTYKVTVIADRIARRVSNVANAVGGLNLSQWRVLAAIGDRDGRTASQVVDITPMDKGIVSRAVASLVASGYLERRASMSDGRLSHLYMTEDGRRIYDAIVAELAATGLDGAEALPTGRQQDFLDTLDRLIDSYPKGR
ncbi:MAG: MarR family winged helix-turn-helix transcriptional regulator [Litorimonas sp.]